MSDLTAFWIFVAIVVVAALWYHTSRNREKHKTIRLAIEKGMQLDAALLYSLDKPKPAIPEHYSIGGFITIAAGIGLIIFGFFIAKVEAAAFYPLIGAGILTALVGISLLLVSRWIKNRRNEDHEL